MVERKWCGWWPFRVDLSVVADLIFLLTLLAFLLRRFAKAFRREEKLASDIEAARQVQQVLVPGSVQAMPGFAVEAVYLPAETVGGDFYQVLPQEDGSVLVVVGDVSGKGLRAAMTVSSIVGALRTMAATSPADVLRTFNRALAGNLGGGFVTCCAARISAAGNGASLMTIANAGHLSPYRNGEEMATDAGLPLGLVEGIEYEETQRQLTPGDRLTFLSDGVVDAQSAAGELFGFARTEAISGQSAETIADAARAFGQDDDITVLTIALAG